MTSHLFCKSFIVASMACCALSSCQPNPAPVKGSEPYALEKAVQEWTLAKALNEISGMSVWGVDTLVAIEDESGTLYFISASNGSILKQAPFGRKGDYEGVAAVPPWIYTVEGSGKLHRIRATSQGYRDNSYFTNLTDANNVEGLCYDEPRRRLLLLCKDAPEISDDQDYKHQRAVYSWSIDSNVLSPKPLFTIYEKEVQKLIRTKYAYSDNQELPQLRPADIGIHPLSGDIFVVSSRGNFLVVLSPTYALKDVILLPNDEALQLEGLCFDSEGAIYLSSEADGKQPKLYKYLPK